MASPHMLLVVSLVAMSISACRQDPRPPAPSPAALVESANLALAQMGRYDFPAAVDAFTALAAAHPGVPEVSFNLALALTNRQGDGDAAQAERLLAGLVDTRRSRFAPATRSACSASTAATTPTRFPSCATWPAPRPVTRSRRILRGRHGSARHPRTPWSGS
jgi:hypothetical protein